MNDATIGNLAALVAVIATVSTTYGRALGPTQMELVQWIVDAFTVPGRYRGLLNLATGLVLALLLSLIVSLTIDDRMFMTVGILAGIMASVEAARTHDRENVAISIN